MHCQLRLKVLKRKGPPMVAKPACASCATSDGTNRGGGRGSDDGEASRAGGGEGASEERGSDDRGGGTSGACPDVLSGFHKETARVWDQLDKSGHDIKEVKIKGANKPPEPLTKADEAGLSDIERNRRDVAAAKSCMSGLQEDADWIAFTPSEAPWHPLSVHPNIASVS